MTPLELALLRVGGRAALEAKIDDRQSGELLVDESPPGWFSLILVDGDGRVVETLESVRVAVSSAVRDDQLAILEADRVALAPLVSELLDANLPESVRRLMDGNR